MIINKEKKAFTLAEILVVITVIGVLTAILIPTAFHATPDENVMRFKKANATLYRVITELVSSGAYNAEGDLGLKADGSGDLITDTDFFCLSFADILTVKSQNCAGGGTAGSYINMNSYSAGSKTVLQQFEEALDDACKTAQATVGNQIVTSDDIVWFEASPATPFGSTTTISESTVRVFTKPDDTPPDDFKDVNGFDTVYKVFCIDVDGGTGASSDKTEAPFGYGIRSDGKILPGARALEWTQKEIQNKD